MSFKVLLAFILMGLVSAACGQSAATPEPLPDPNSQGSAAREVLPEPKSPAKGAATVIGGTVSKLDPVRDELTVRVFGSRKTMKVLFDPRTRFYRDGVPAGSADLRKDSHISMETRLEGTDVVAESIHIFGQASSGECKGQVVGYDAGKGELLVRDTLSPDPVKLTVSPQTMISGKGQESAAAAADLTKGALIEARFSPDSHGKRLATSVTVLALPGAEFTFSGSITFLDLHSGMMAIKDPQDQTTYEITFDPKAIKESQKLREGENVTVRARFEGDRYQASAIDRQASAE
jgi:hypothetical protein